MFGHVSPAKIQTRLSIPALIRIFTELILDRKDYHKSFFMWTKNTNMSLRWARMSEGTFSHILFYFFFFFYFDSVKTYIVITCLSHVNNSMIVYIEC